MNVNKFEIKKLETAGARLLSVDEAEKYLTQNERKYKGSWWLSTPYGHYSAVCVDNEGHICEQGCFVDNEDIYVRPALIISNLESTDFKVGDIFRIDADYGWMNFKIITSELAWMYDDDIGQHIFNYKIDGNNYNDSFIADHIEDQMEYA